MTIALQTAHLNIEIDADDGMLAERYYAASPAGRILIANGGPPEILDALRQPIPAGGWHATSVDGRVRITGRMAHGTIERTIGCDDDGWIVVETRLLPGPEPLVLGSCMDCYAFAHPASWCYLPSVGGFAHDAQYKAPLALIQDGPMAIAVVPDLDAIDRADLARCNHAMRLDAPTRSISVGHAPGTMVSHCVYAPDRSRSWTAGSPVVNRHLLLVTASAAPRQAFRAAVRLHWNRFGRPAQPRTAGLQAGTGPELGGLTTFDSWRNQVWDGFSRRAWLSVPLPGGATGGAVRMDRWGGAPSVYLGSWFNSMRTAVGMALWARRAGRGDLLDLAGQTLALALHAPGRDGAFKCIAAPGAAGVRWAAGDGCGASTEGGYLGFDMAWTGYWMLRWRAEGLPGSGPVLDRLRALAGFLVGHQEADGLLPTVFDESGACDRARSRLIHAEGGALALFLLELSAQDGDDRWRSAALRCLGFIAREVMPSRTWYDFETFWSCSPRDASLDRATGQWPANNLALIPTAHAFLLAWRQTGDRTWLDLGLEALDYLLLSQQCWTNPLLEDLNCPDMMHGGFTTQNSDAEWSDARQSQAGVVLLDYWQATGDVEFLERGIAALRAQFPVSPAENWAHNGYGGKSGVSSFHWGTGSGLAGIELTTGLVGDVIVDVGARKAVGVDAIDVLACDIHERSIALRLRSATPSRRHLRVVARNADAGAWRLSVDGAPPIVTDAAGLEQGIVFTRS